MEKHPLNLAKFPAYSLPNIYGWHLLPKQNMKETGKIFKYFGANWWDLLLEKKLPLSKGKIKINTKKTHSVIFINLGCDKVVMTNRNTGDVYNVMPGKRSLVNNTNNEVVTFVSNKKGNLMHLTRISSIYIVLLQIEQIKEGSCLVDKSDVFNDFFLMNGIPDQEQYMNTVGLELLDKVVLDGWKVADVDKGAKSDFTYYLYDHWKLVNPKKRPVGPRSIPLQIHWIWLRRDIHKQEFGELKPVFHKFMNTWIERNPNFEFNLWTDNPNFKFPEKYSFIKVRGPSDIKDLLNKLPTEVERKIKYLYNNHENVGARSDTLRQCILYLEGGIYSDVNDGACLAPMEKLCKRFDFLIGLEPVMYVNNAVIGSSKKHPFNKAMIAWLAHNSKTFVEEWHEMKDASQTEKDDYIVSTTGPIAMTFAIFGVMETNADISKSLILPAAWIYPNYWIPTSPTEWLKPVSITAHYDRRDYLK